MKKHKITFWGVRGSFPISRQDSVKIGGNTSCVELRTSNNEMIVFDMGSGLVEFGKKLMSKKNYPKEMSVFISHFHWDHMIGFLGFAPLFDDQLTINLYGKEDKLSADEVIDYMLHKTFWPVDMPMFKAKLVPKTFPKSSIRIGNDTKISHTLHGHPNGANSYRVELGTHVIAYSTDCEHPESHLNPNVIENARDADILIHDAQYTIEQLPAHKGWGHSTWKQAVDVAKQANVKKLILFHHDPAHTDEQVREIERKAQKEFPNTVAAYQGMTLEL